MSETRICACTHPASRHEDGNWFCNDCQCDEFVPGDDASPPVSFDPLPEPVADPEPSESDRARQCLRDLAGLPDHLARQVVARWCRVKGYTLMEPRRGV